MKDNSEPYRWGWASVMNAAFREWRPDEWFDCGFLLGVPVRERKVLTRKVQPLTTEANREVEKSLFTGIKEPLHPSKATGWAKKLLHAGYEDPNISTCEAAVSVIRKKIRWSDSDVVLLVYWTVGVYATKWATFLDYFEKGYINLDNPLICHPEHREVILFWEGDCRPIFGKRNERKLPSMAWHLPNVPWNS